MSKFTMSGNSSTQNTIAINSNEANGANVNGANAAILNLNGNANINTNSLITDCINFSNNSEITINGGTITSKSTDTISYNAINEITLNDNSSAVIEIVSNFIDPNREAEEQLLRSITLNNNSSAKVFNHHNSTTKIIMELNDSSCLTLLDGSNLSNLTIKESDNSIIDIVTTSGASYQSIIDSISSCTGEQLIENAAIFRDIAKFNISSDPIGNIEFLTKGTLNFNVNDLLNYINCNYFTLNAVTKDGIEGSDLEIFPQEILSYITSFLDFSAENGIDIHDTDNTIVELSGSAEESENDFNLA